MKNIITTFLFLLIVFSSKAQNIGVGTNTPHPSAALEISDSSKGILIPRMTMSQRLAIQNPAEGLMVYQTGNNKGYWYYDGTLWVLSLTFNNSQLSSNLKRLQTNVYLKN